VRINGCPENLCRDYLALFAVGSLVGKATEIDMKFTREHGVVRARIDCTNPHAIPSHVSHFYDGEGFTVYFNIEAPDGSVVPAGEFNMGGGEEGDKGNPSDPKNDHNVGDVNPRSNQTVDDPSLPKSKDDSMEGSKSDDMQQDTLEMFSALKVGQILLNCTQSPRSSSSEKNKTKAAMNASSKRWADIVEESDEGGVKSAPPCSGETRQGALLAPNSARPSRVAAAAGSTCISVPGHKAPGTQTFVPPVSLQSSPHMPGRFSAEAQKSPVSLAAAGNGC
jgi:hypothetical protein